VTLKLKKVAESEGMGSGRAGAGERKSEGESLMERAKVGEARFQGG